VFFFLIIDDFYCDDVSYTNFENEEGIMLFQVRYQVALLS